MDNPKEHATALCCADWHRLAELIVETDGVTYSQALAQIESFLTYELNPSEQQIEFNESSASTSRGAEAEVKDRAHEACAVGDRY